MNHRPQMAALLFALALLATPATADVVIPAKYCGTYRVKDDQMSLYKEIHMSTTLIAFWTSFDTSSRPMMGTFDSYSTNNVTDCFTALDKDQPFNPTGTLVQMPSDLNETYLGDINMYIAAHDGAYGYCTPSDATYVVYTRVNTVCSGATLHGATLVAALGAALAALTLVVRDRS